MVKKELKIGIMGTGSWEMSDEQRQAAQEIGKEIAAKGHVALTGGGKGLPAVAAEEAKKAGGTTVGFSPAKDLEKHKAYGLPVDIFSDLIFTGLGFVGRNPLNIYNSDALIFIGGEYGTLNEFTVAYKEGKVIGVLVGSGGVVDRFRDLERTFSRKTESVIFYEKDPKKLVGKVVSACLSK